MIAASGIFLTRAKPCGSSRKSSIDAAGVTFTHTYTLSHTFVQFTKTMHPTLMLNLAKLVAIFSFSMSIVGGRLGENVRENEIKYNTKKHTAIGGRR